MNSNQIESGLVKNEWQLGTQLNIAVTNGTRDKFNLLLSLLSEDARDFSQFELPKATQASLSEVELRDYLQLPAPQPLVNQGMSLQQCQKISVAIQQRNLNDARLQSLLNNEAILSRSAEVDFDPDVVENLSFLAQTRLKHAQAKVPNDISTAKGIDYTLMQKYQDLNLDKKPLRVTYN